MHDAGEDFNVPVDYRNPPTGDTSEMVRILEQAAARNYSGVITTVLFGKLAAEAGADACDEPCAL
jgi:hypothetical protein